MREKVLLPTKSWKLVSIRSMKSQLNPNHHVKLMASPQMNINDIDDDDDDGGGEGGEDLAKTHKVPDQD